MQKREVPLLITDTDLEQGLHGLSWAFGTYLTGLWSRGVRLERLPDDLSNAGCFNIACAGRRSNGSRTSLRNMVIQEGLPFTLDFLGRASSGAAELGYWFSMNANPFKAELEWLSLVGADARSLLEDRTGHQSFDLLQSVDAAFFSSLNWPDVLEKHFIESLSEQVASELSAFRANDMIRLDQTYARIHSFVRSHPRLEIVKSDQRSARIDEIASGLGSRVH